MSKLIKQIASIALLALLLFLIFVAVSRGQSTSESVPTGGSYTLEKNVVAGGGKDKQISQISENGTTGQSVAGHRSQTGAFTLWSGFWTPEQNVVPTAAMVEISGRVISVDGRGVKNVVVTLTSQSGMLMSALTNAFGYYRFSGVEAGGAYIVSVSAKRYTFAESTKVFNVKDNITDIDFVALRFR